jgi:hypothetical protein
MKIKLIAIPKEAGLPSYFKVGSVYEVVDTIYGLPVMEDPTTGVRYGVVREMYEEVIVLEKQAAQ